MRQDLCIFYRAKFKSVFSLVEETFRLLFRKPELRRNLFWQQNRYSPHSMVLVSQSIDNQFVVPTNYTSK